MYDPSLVEPLSATLVYLLEPAQSAQDGGPHPEALIAGTIRNEETWELFLAACSASKPLFCIPPALYLAVCTDEGRLSQGRVN